MRSGIGICLHYFLELFLVKLLERQRSFFQRRVVLPERSAFRSVEQADRNALTPLFGQRQCRRFVRCVMV